MAARAGRDAIRAFPERGWARELDHRLVEDLWTSAGHRIAVRSGCEWRDDTGSRCRSYGDEIREFDAHRPMRRPIACIDDLTIDEADREFRRPVGPRPADLPGLSDLGL